MIERLFYKYCLNLNKFKAMNRIALSLVFLFAIGTLPCITQHIPDYSKIDMLLIRGDFKKAIDTCNQIVSMDTLNSEIYYKLGLAYQNILSDDKAFDCFLKASSIAPDNDNYSFTVAKSYFNKGKIRQAKPIFLKLYDSDTLNWPYAYYLTSIYMQEQKYDESINIYNRFYKQDTGNYVFMDKIGFASLRKGDSEIAIDMFNRSLAANPKNINAIKNVAYLYAVSHRIDTAIVLLTRGIDLDVTDMDLLARRAALNYSLNYTKRAMDDYLKILATGDSTLLYLKRAGIGYANNLQPEKAIPYLLKAYDKDTADFEVLRFLARNYERIKDLKKSAVYYMHIIDLLSPAIPQLGMNYILLAEVLKADKQYNEAISAYNKSQEYRNDNSIIINIANLYDEKLNDIPKAIRYYEMFLNRPKSNRDMFDNEFVESVRKRVESLKKNQLPAK
jgi:tetratricopeptide (TPR) repeat protein